MRWIFVAAGLAGLGYFVTAQTGLSDGTRIAIKGSGVALVALWCAVQARNIDGWLITATMALGAVGDVLIEWRLEAGAVAFMIAHSVAIWLYLRKREPRIFALRDGRALLVVPACVIMAIIVVPGGAAPGVAVYALFVATMAAVAWTSRFPHNFTGIGAMMFLVSDMLIFARMGPLSHSFLPDLLVWPLYFAGQMLIAHGVVITLRMRANGQGA